jgi:hypothetical protein
VPALVAQLGREPGRADDIGEQHRGQHPVGVSDRPGMLMPTWRSSLWTRNCCPPWGLDAPVGGQQVGGVGDKAGVVVAAEVLALGLKGRPMA